MAIIWGVPQVNSNVSEFGGSEKSETATSGTSSSPIGTQASSSKTDEEKKLATSNNAVYQDFKLYVEGEECPFESASISFGVSIIPTMTLQLMPYKILRNLEERTKVHFYFIDPVDSKERLLFDGEIRGVGYTKNPTAQTLTYSVMHVSQYLDEILVSFFDISAFAVTFPPLYTKTFGAELEADYSSYNETTLAKVLSPPSMKELNTKEAAEKGINTFQQLFVEMFSEIFKVRAGETELNTTLQYYKNKVDEWKLDRRIVTLPAASGEVDAAITFGKFIESENNILLLLDKVKKIDGWQSMFTVLGEMFKEILYYPIILPSPYLYESTTSVPNDLGETIVSVSEQLQTILYKPQALFVLPPICNVIWPSMYTVFSYSRNFKSRPTRLFVRVGIERYMSDDSAILEAAAQYFWAPKELQAEIDGAGKAIAQYKADEAVYKIIDSYSWYNPALTEASKTLGVLGLDALKAKTDVHKSLLSVSSKREREVGVRISQPTNNQFFTTFAKWLVDSKSKEVYEDQMAKLLDYELTRQQFETEAVSLVMVFNPYVVPGFPTLIMDKPESGMHVYGYVSGVTHTISAAGGCSTMMDVGYIHQYDEEVNKRFIVAEDAWADEDAVYERLLGVKSIKSARFNTIEDEKNKDNATEIVKNIAANMARSDFYDYVYNAYARSSRNIVTKTEYDEFVGDMEKNMSKKDIENRQKTQNKVRQYRAWVEERVAASPDLEDGKFSGSTASVATGVSGASGAASGAVPASFEEAKTASVVKQSDSSVGVELDDAGKYKAYWTARYRTAKPYSNDESEAKFALDRGYSENRKVSDKDFQSLFREGGRVSDKDYREILNKDRIHDSEAGKNW